MSGRAVLVVLASALLGGCPPSLPPCDDAAAHAVVFLDAPSDLHPDDGVPMYEGQAILYQSCGANSFCHASRAEGGMRAGAPEGLDFDTGPACIGHDCAMGDPSRSRLESRIAHVRAHARDIYAAVDYGSMPPGSVGVRVVARAGGFRRLPADGATLASGALVDTIHTARGRRSLGVWLACGAPVVGTVHDPDGAHLPGDSCTSSTASAGDCVTRLPATPVAIGTCAPGGVPSYDELYAKLFDPLCSSSCHSESTPRTGTPRFSTVDATYEALLDPTVEDRLVVPGNASASHVVHHLEGLFGFDLMPLGMFSDRLPHDVLTSVRAWIDAGAPRNCP